MVLTVTVNCLRHPAHFHRPLRGFLMLCMVSGNLGTTHLFGEPNWDWLAEQFHHTDWVGCTFWDLVHPSFAFIVGVAMPFSRRNRQVMGQTRGQYLWHIVKRSLTLLALGIFIDCYTFDTIHVGFTRVLQQIAIGYLFAYFARTSTGTGG